MEFPDPSGKMKVVIHERFLFDEGIDIEIRTPHKSVVVYSSPRMDWLVGFTAVAWRHNPERTLVFTCNRFGGYGPVALEVDLNSWHVESGRLVREELSREIRSKYRNLRTSQDPADWAYSQEGYDAFVRLR